MARRARSRRRPWRRFSTRSAMRMRRSRPPSTARSSRRASAARRRSRTATGSRFWRRGREDEVDAAYLSALSALAGSVVGGLTTGLSTWISQSVSAEASLLSSHLARREELFRDFVISASRVYGEALTSNDPKIPELVELYSLLSRMRILCRP